MGILTAWQQILVYLAVIAVVFGAGWEVKGWKDDAALKAQDDAMLLAQQKAAQGGAAMAAKYEATIAGLNQQNAVLSKEWSDDRLKNIPDCPLSPGALKLLKAGNASASSSR